MIKVTNQIIAKGLSPETLNTLEKELIVINPKWANANKMGRYCKHLPKHLKAWKEEEEKFIIPIGCLNRLKELEPTVKIIDERTLAPVSFKFKGELKPFQVQAVKSLVKGGILEAPTGAGKTVMALKAIELIGQKTLIVVHTKELLNQWTNRICQFIDIRLKDIGHIGGGEYKVGKITIAMVQSLYKKVKALKDTFGTVVIDECHRTPSRTFTEALEGLSARYKIGLSATPFRNDGLGNFIFWYIGPLAHSVSKEELIERGDIVQPKFILRETEFRSRFDPLHEYSKMINELTLDRSRNHLICEDVFLFKKTDKSCLILTDRVQHGEELKRILDSKGIHSELLTAGVKPEKRKSIVKSVNSGELKFIIATGQLIGEGFDCKNLSVLFLTTPIKYTGRIIQYIGRIMRPEKNKRPLVYDYVDWEVPVLARSARHRIKSTYGKDNVYYS